MAPDSRVTTLISTEDEKITVPFAWTIADKRGVDVVIVTKQRLLGAVPAADEASTLVIFASDIAFNPVPEADIYLSNVVPDAD